MAQEEKDLIIDCEKLLQNCKELEKEMKAIEDGVDFLINEYNTNKHYFRVEPGKVTIEDVIKTCFELGWSSKSNFDYDKQRKITSSLDKDLKQLIDIEMNDPVLGKLLNRNAAYVLGKEIKLMLIERACEWLERNEVEFWNSPCNPDKIVEQFRKAMKGD